MNPLSYNKKCGIVASYFIENCEHIGNGIWDIKNKLHVEGIKDSGELVFSKENFFEGLFLLSPPFEGGGNSIVF